jgi:hypothetical protein
MPKALEKGSSTEGLALKFSEEIKYVSPKGKWALGIKMEIHIQPNPNPSLY